MKDGEKESIIESDAHQKEALIKQLAQKDK